MTRKILFALTFGIALLSGCITKNYYCNCAENCKCKYLQEQKAQASDDNGNVVSPDRINDSTQDSNAPQMHKDKPWYML